MKKYFIDDIKVIHWQDHFRKRWEMYFGSEGPSSIEIANALKDISTLLGAKKTHTDEIDGWQYFCADVDWIFNSVHPIQSIEQVFCNYNPVPESNGSFTYRFEVLTIPYSSDVYTYNSDDIVVLKGATPGDEVLANHSEILGIWGRVVGFKYDFDHTDSS